MIDVEIKTRSNYLYCEIHDWCVDRFGKTGNYADDTWSSRQTVEFGYAMFYFEYEKDAMLFMLRWL